MSRAIRKSSLADQHPSDVDLASFFGVSAVEMATKAEPVNGAWCKEDAKPLQVGDVQVRVALRPSKDAKCPRCWLYTRPAKEELCERCDDVVRQSSK